jgi:hypothetical protein
MTGSAVDRLNWNPRSSPLQIEALSLEAVRCEPPRPARLTISFHVVNASDQPILHPLVARILPGEARASQVKINSLAAGQTAYISHSLAWPGGVHDFEVHVEVAAAGCQPSVATRHFKNPTPDVGRWVSIGPRHINTTSGEGGAGGVLSAIAIDPANPSTIYVGSLGSGVWKTADTGASWRPLTDNLPTLAIAALAVDPITPSRVYAATPAGFFRSDDGGTSWLQVAGQTAETRFGALLIDPTRPNILYLTSTSGVFRSTDFGAT